MTLGPKVQAKIPAAQVDSIVGNQINSNFHKGDFYGGFVNGATLLASSYVGLSDAAFAFPEPNAAQRTVDNARGFLGVQLAVGLLILTVLISVVLSVLARRRGKRVTA